MRLVRAGRTARPSNWHCPRTQPARALSCHTGQALSPEARAYFAAGGLGILIGDGQLNYRPEQILEAYYAYSLNQWATLTFDYQFIVNPGYNADRGPVSIFSGRLHAEF